MLKFMLSIVTDDAKFAKTMLALGAVGFLAIVAGIALVLSV
jgi:hypothetical protein